MDEEEHPVPRIHINIRAIDNSESIGSQY